MLGSIYERKKYNRIDVCWREEINKTIPLP